MTTTSKVPAKKAAAKKAPAKTASKAGRKDEIEMTLTKEGKSVYRFDATVDTGVVGNVYVSKDFFNGEKPNKITVTIER